MAADFEQTTVLNDIEVGSTDLASSDISLAEATLPSAEEAQLDLSTTEVSTTTTVQPEDPFQSMTFSSAVDLIDGVRESLSGMAGEEQLATLSGNLENNIEVSTTTTMTTEEASPEVESVAVVPEQREVEASEQGVFSKALKWFKDTTEPAWRPLVEATRSIWEPVVNVFKKVFDKEKDRESSNLADLGAVDLDFSTTVDPSQYNPTIQIQVDSTTQNLTYRPVNYLKNIYEQTEQSVKRWGKFFDGLLEQNRREELAQEESDKVEEERYHLDRQQRQEQVERLVSLHPELRDNDVLEKYIFDPYTVDVSALYLQVQASSDELTEFISEGVRVNNDQVQRNRKEESIS